MLRILATGSILKDFTRNERENGVVEFTIRVGINEPYKKADNTQDSIRNMLICKVFKKSENAQEFQAGLREGQSVFVECDMPKAQASVNPRTNNVYGFFTADSVKQFLLLGKDSTNFIKLYAIGNICADAEIRDLKNETDRKAVNFSVACNERKGKDKDGNPIENAVFVNCGMFRAADKTGIANYLEKGQKIFCEGRPVVRVNTNDAGEPKAYFNADIQNVEFVGSAKKDESFPATSAPASVNADFYSENPVDDLPF